MPAVGTKRTASHVRYPVANGGRPDMARTAYFGRKNDPTQTSSLLLPSRRLWIRRTRQYLTRAISTVTRSGLLRLSVGSGNALR